MTPPDAMLDSLEQQVIADGIESLLIQFVDIHGAAKVKLVPAGRLREVVEQGVGFVGGAVWGLGQGPHSPDFPARADLATTPRSPTSPASHGSPATSTTTASRTPTARGSTSAG